MSSSQLFKDIRACTLCEKHLPLVPNPVLRGRASAKIRIVGQAPGTKVHKSGVPWDDQSGKVLRGWLGLDAETFYDESQVAITPMGFCYPGRDKNGGDLPPRPECGPKWHPLLQKHFKNEQLVLLIGSYAQEYYLGEGMKKTMTETVRAFRDYLPHFIPLPHPSWRNIGWRKKNPWFEKKLLPELRKRVQHILNG
ncbi:MAG: uracil-DNA glycosylase family protein [Proteobacteria bacterium]|nr:uracil-DNA glycosylase family protein [Pseudomonadota bacterium]